jgi:conjugal transfer pilus assembly protein TraU
VKLRALLAAFALLAFLNGPIHAVCVGKFINPITDICWECFFPIKIAGITVFPGGDDPGSSNAPICFCKRPPLPLPLPGIPVAFWEPVRLVDVTRTPYCFVSLGGLSLGGSATGRGDIEEDPEDNTKRSFYHVHWYIYPAFFLFEKLIDFVCVEMGSFDVAYISELDPLWNDDEKSAIINPEALVFGNPIAQLACVADCVAASASLPLDPLFWCGGCQGSLYPFTGTVGDHVGGVQASLLLVQRMAAKLHRQLLLWGTYGDEARCNKYPMPIIKKTMYRTQMTYPGNPGRCDPMGRTETLWQAGREFPYKGSDFGYLLWRKRDCCLL